MQAKWVQMADGIHERCDPAGSGQATKFEIRPPHNRERLTTDHSAKFDHDERTSTQPSNPGATGVHNGRILNSAHSLVPQVTAVLMLRARRDSNP